MQAIGFIGMFSGLILSYIADTPASASITLLFVALAFVFLLIAMRRINPMAGYGRKHAGGKQHG